MAAPGKGADELTAAIASRSGATVLALLQASPASVPADLRGLWSTLNAEEQAAVARRLALCVFEEQRFRERLILAACQADDAAAVAALAKDSSLVNSGWHEYTSPLHVAIELERPARWRHWCERVRMCTV
jgi:hypothetical protein